MIGNRGGLGSDLAKVDDYENTAADYDETPEPTDEFCTRNLADRHQARQPL